MRSRTTFLVSVVFSLGLCIWSYLPGLSGPFLFDDYDNIYENDFLKIERFTLEDLWQASISNSSGPLKRPVAMFSFAINHVLTGMDPWWMKVTNLGIHLLNGLLLGLVLQFLLARLLTLSQHTAQRAAAVVALLWLVHPVNVTAVSYIVQRMTSLSASFVLLALYCYLRLREAHWRGWRAGVAVVSILALWLLGLLTKETAILLSVYVFAVEWCVYGFRTTSGNEKNNLSLLWSLLAAPWLGALFFILYEPSIILEDYGKRDFTLSERLLTEGRVVMDYLRLVLVPDIGHMGLFHDDVVISSSLFKPITSLLSLLAIGGLLLSALYLRKRLPLYSLGVLWFFGGQVLESTIYPLELMFLHRNYLPSIGLLLVMAELVGLIYLRYRSLSLVAICIVTLGFSLSTRSLAYQWSGDYRMSILQVMSNPDSVRANFRAGQIVKVYAISETDSERRMEYKNMAIDYFNRVRQLEKSDLSGEMSILAMYLQMHESPPQDLVKKLVKDLGNAKANAGIINNLVLLKNCFNNESCRLREEDFEKITVSLINNPNMKKYESDYARRLRIIYAGYLADHHRNVDAAIAVVIDALKIAPTLEDLALLAQYYEKAGYLEKMKQTILLIEEQDRFGKFRKFTRQTREKYPDLFISFNPALTLNKTGLVFPVNSYAPGLG